MKNGFEGWQKRYGLLEVIFFPIIALLGVITRIVNDSIVHKHYKKHEQAIMNNNNNNND